MTKVKFSCLLNQYYGSWWSSGARTRLSEVMALTYPGSKVHGANMGPIWGRQDPGGPHFGPMNFTTWVVLPEYSVFSTGKVYRVSREKEITVKLKAWWWLMAIWYRDICNHHGNIIQSECISKAPLCMIVFSSPPGQNGRPFPNDIFTWIFTTKMFCILIKISLKFVPRGPVDNISTLV